MKEKEKLQKLLKSRFSRLLDEGETDDGVWVHHFSSKTVFFTLCYQRGEVCILPDIGGKYEFCVCFGDDKYYCRKHDNSVESIFRAIIDAYYNN